VDVDEWAKKKMLYRLADTSALQAVAASADVAGTSIKVLSSYGRWDAIRDPTPMIFAALFSKNLSSLFFKSFTPTCRCNVIRFDH